MSVSIAKKRNCDKQQNFDCLTGETKQICIPIEKTEYEEVTGNPKKFRGKLDEIIKKYPEIFPEEIENGYWLQDILPKSKKLPDLTVRRVKITKTDEVYTILPSFVMRYMTAYASDVEKAMFLRHFNVPYWALTFVFGKNDMFWYRIENQIGRNSIVGTTIKKPENLPDHTLADEKFSRQNSQQVYLPLVTSSDCILGIKVVTQVDHLSLISAYGDFKKEAQNVDPEYQPKTCTSDGWKATRWAWKMLFPSTTLILCFFHSFMKIRDCFYSIQQHYQELSSKVWDAYHSPDFASFSTALSDLKSWATLHISCKKARKAVYKLCDKVSLFAPAYSFPSSYRTTAHLDRIMDSQDRFLYSRKYFHGHFSSAQYSVRAWAILRNFSPYSPQFSLSKQFLSPAHRINGFVYHENWFQNLLVSSSMGGFRPTPQKTLQ